MTQTWNGWTLDNPPVNGAFLTDRGWEILIEGVDPAKGLTELIVAFSQPNPTVNAGASNISLITMNTGVLDTSDKVVMNVYFNENVVVDTTAGTPTIPVIVGSTARTAVYVSGSGTNKLVFEYIILATEVDLDGVSLTGTTIALNLGTITDADGVNQAILTYTTTTFVNTVVDTVDRTIVDVVYTNTVDVDTDGVISFTVQYNQPVSVTGSPRIPLFKSDGVTPLAGGFATFSSVSGNDVLFSYNVLAVDSEAVGIKVGPNIDLNSGTIVANPNTEKTVSLTFVQETTLITLNQA